MRRILFVGSYLLPGHEVGSQPKKKKEKCVE